VRRLLLVVPRRLQVLLAVVCIGLLIPTASAGAKLVGDGERYAAWDADGVVHVLDDRGPSRTVAIPAGCSFQAVGGGRLLFDCTTHDTSDLIAQGRTWNIAKRAYFDLPTWAPVTVGAGSADGASYAAIGAHWASIATSGYHWVGAAYVPLGAGKIRFASEVDIVPLPWERTVADLNSSQLRVTMCAPLRAPGYGFSANETQALYQHPYLALLSLSGELRLRHCGQAKAQRITGCSSGCKNVALEGDVLAWTDRDKRAHLRTHLGPTQAWRPAGGATQLVLTGRRAVAMTSTGRIAFRALPR
jgi:hypothetical protein